MLHKIRLKPGLDKQSSDTGAYTMPKIGLSFFMSAISYLGKLDDPLIKNLILIPITGQMLHFYLDSFIWKFSEEHNRQNTLKFILEKI